MRQLLCDIHGGRIISMNADRVDFHMLHLPGDGCNLTLLDHSLHPVPYFLWIYKHSFRFTSWNQTKIVIVISIGKSFNGIGYASFFRLPLHLRVKWNIEHQVLLEKPENIHNH